MSQLNLYYRAFREYRKYTLADKACVKQRQQFKNSPTEDDKLETIRTVCIIDEEWVQKIEEGLPFVEKAIAEERQFIKNEGEVLDIEKIKRVSKDSVEHLARHSEMITHLPKDGGDIIPDKIYMVERLSDYAVYENRFLYMLLCYLRDFIDLRLKRIKELGNTYNATTVVKRDIHTVHGRITFESTFHEETKRDPYAVFDKNTVSLIDRIESCQHVVASLLAKPLMVIVSKSPMLKPPITKTNVLKMNVKFKNSAALYEYLSSYLKPGYTIEEIKRTISPFTEDLADEISELMNLTSFLTYEYGNGLNEKLGKEYAEEEKERADAERRKLLQRIEEIKARFLIEEINAEEYVASLENALNNFNAENQRLRLVEKDYNVLTEKHEDLKKEKIELNKKLADSDREVREKIKEIEDMTVRHEIELKDAEDRRINELHEQELEFNEKEQNMKTAFETEITTLNARHGEEMEKQKTESDLKISELESKFNELDKMKTALNAQIHALKGISIDEDFSSMDKFEELEKEFLAFYDLFMAQWKDTKKKIRKEILWNKVKKLREKV
jgi:hypothetical protein